METLILFSAVGMFFVFLFIRELIQAKKREKAFFVPFMI